MPSGNFNFDNDRMDDAAEEEGTTVYQPMRYDFTIQMAWLPRSPKERFETREARLEEEKKAAQEAADAAELAQESGQ